MRARMTSAPASHQNDVLVRLGNTGAFWIGGPIAFRSSASSSLGVGDPDRALRVADAHVLEGERAGGGDDLAAAVVGARG